MKQQRISKYKLSDLKPNPDNPRVIRDSNFKKLVKSLKEFPEMLELREVVIDEDGFILGGNQRYLALKELRIREVPVVQITGLSAERKKEFIVKDNVNYGVWDWDILGNEYDPGELKEYGLNVWQPQEAIDDAMDYDFEDEQPKNDMADIDGSGDVDDKPPVYVVEFDISDYPAAFQLAKDVTDLGGSVGDILVKVLKENYED
tara:strand:- start:5136 stop:5744 length:609 start_codon:yes stop_codon:yes gene_type:complete